MRVKPFIQIVLIAVALLAPCLQPARADEKQEPIEKYSARAFSLDRGAASFLDMAVFEWTTPEDRQRLIQTFLDGGSEALYDALGREKRKGYLRLPGSLAYDMMYAWRAEQGGKQRIVLATDRPMALFEMTRNTRSTDYNVSLVVLEILPGVRPAHPSDATAGDPH